MRLAVVTVALAFVASVPAAEVEIVRDVAYYEGADADEYRHKLDLYLPKGGSARPVVVFVHGGGWVVGNKNGFCPGLSGTEFGKFFAERDVVAVFTNYRLSPKVKHPEHVIDVARAVAWVRRNIAKHGGDVDRVYLMGHSAGGHLVSLVTCDPQYLAGEGLTPAMIKGVIPVSGVFNLTIDLGPNAGPDDNRRVTGPAEFFTRVFGAERPTHRAASPLRHVRSGLPPFLVTYADRDMLTLAGQGEQFYEALAEKGVGARKLLMKDRTHVSILRNVVKKDDPLGQAVLAFIRSGTP